MIPAFLICGYLGAGKTTLVNRLLNEKGGRRLVVLVNDFGGINIDEELIVDANEAVISLANGCACCTIQDSLGDSLDFAQAMSPDGVVIEASGVALPQKIAAFVDGWPGIRLAGSVTLVDSLNLETLLADKFVAPLVQDQVRGSSRIVLTKEDLVSNHAIEAVTACVSRLNANAEISIGSTSLVIDELIGVETFEDEIADGGGSHIAFDTATFTSAGTFERDTLTRLLRKLPRDVWRVKGFVNLETANGEPTRHVVQRVGNRTILEVDEAGAMQPDYENRVVFIAPKGLVELDDHIRAFSEAVIEPITRVSSE